MSAPQIGTGATVVFSAATGFLAQPTSISHSGIERPAVDTTHLGTTAARTFKSGELYDPGEVTVALLLDPTTAPPIISTATGTLTITYMALGVWKVPSAICTGFSITNALEERIEAEMTFKLSGALTVS